jgi:hypothetical protein
MSRFAVIPLIVLLLSACQFAKNPVLVESSSPQEVFCQGRMAWSAEATKDNIVDSSTFWIAFEQAPVQENFNHINVEATLDGKPVLDGFQYTQFPEPYSVTCTDGGQQFESARMRYILLLPPLSTGEHEIVWKYTLMANLSDDLFDYRKGMSGEIAGVVNVQ